MSTEERGSFHRFTSWWPLVVTALAITVSAAQANTRLDVLNDRVVTIEQTGTVAGNERLARLESQQQELQRSLNRIEQKLDNELTISPESRKRLNRL
jgi:valyl-tRNA synthetase